MMDFSNIPFSPLLRLNYPVIKGKIPYWEDYYLKSMMQMRVMRLEIPLDFTPEKLYDFLVSKCFKINNDGFVSFLVGIPLQKEQKLINPTIYFCQYTEAQVPYTKIKIDLWQIPVWDTSMYNSLEINHPVLATMEKYKDELAVDDLLIINNEKSIARSIYGSLFLKIQDKKEIWVNAIADGGLDDIARVKFISFLEQNGYSVLENSIKSYQIQQAEAVLIADNRFLAREVTQYRKKTFETDWTKSIIHNFKDYMAFE